MAELIFQEGPAKTIAVVASWLEQYTNMDISVGGGTVLAARWQHRDSTDVDMFYNAHDEYEIFQPSSESDWREFLREKARQGDIDQLEEHYDGCRWQTEFGEASLFRSMNPLSSRSTERDTEQQTGIRCESTIDILYMKLVGRMLHGSVYAARDLYDFVYAKIADPTSLARVHEIIRPFEQTYLLQDWRDGLMYAKDFHSLKNARARLFVESVSVFNRIGGEIITNQISADTADLIRRAKADYIDDDEP